MRLYICGFGRGGKDVTAEYLRDRLGFKFSASSYFCAKLFIYGALQEKYGYSSFEDCFNDRHNHRVEWADMITKYNTPNLTKLSSNIFDSGNDIYVGIRRYEELRAAKEKWNDVFVIWVDAEGRVEDESAESCTVTIDQADIVIRNRGTLTEYYKKLDKLCKLLENK